MTEEVIKEVITSTLASAERTSDDRVVNTTEFIGGNTVPSYLKRKEKQIPRYLRASTGSCHDNCKIGIQHSPESKKYWSFHRRRQNHATGNCKQDQGAIITQRVKPRNKDQTLKISQVKDGSAPAMPKFTKPKPLLKGILGHSEISPCKEELSNEASESIAAGTQPADVKRYITTHDDLSNCGDGESSEGAVSIELEMPLAIQDSDESDDHIIDIVLPSEDVREAGKQTRVDHVSNHPANDCVSSAKRTNMTVMASEKHGQDKNGSKSESFSKESVKPKMKETWTTTRNTVSNHKSEITSRQKSVGAAVESSNAPKTPGKKADVSATSKFNREKGFNSIVPSAFPKLKEIKVPSSSNATGSSARPATLSKLKASAAKKAPSPSLPSGKQTDRKMTVKTVVKNAPLLQNKGEEKVILSPLKLSRSISMSAKSPLSIKMRAVNKKNSASVLKGNKKVYGIGSSTTDCKEKILKTKTASPKIRTPEVNNRETRSRKGKAATPRTKSARGRKPASISSSITSQSPRKLTFRQGKVLNLQINSESNTTILLRFRRAKATDDSSRSKEPTRGRITRDNDTAASDASGASRAEVVVLRRQDFKDRVKNGQGLLNNMIEETASKLVEARKSKVKALVGAFETVISLQERKAAATSS